MSAHTCEHDHNMIESILEYDAYYHDALFLAVQDECVTCVEHVLRYIEHIHPDDARECKYDALLNCIELQNIDLLKLLIMHEVDIDGGNGKPLISAIRLNNLECVRMLIDNGVDVCIRDEAPLQIAKQCGNPEIIAIIERAISYQNDDTIAFK